MVPTCHLCGSEVTERGDVADAGTDGFECADCGEVTCDDCRSIAVGRDSNHCRRCRG